MDSDIRLLHPDDVKHEIYEKKSLSHRVKCRWDLKIAPKNAYRFEKSTVEIRKRSISTTTCMMHSRKIKIIYIALFLHSDVY